MSIQENIIEIKPLKIDINDIFDKKIEITHLFDYSILQRIIEEFINRQKETNDKIKELENKIVKINHIQTISPININQNKESSLINTIPNEVSDDNDLNEIQNLNKEINIKDNNEVNKENKEENIEDNKTETNINNNIEDNNKGVTLLQASKNENKITQMLYQQVLSKVNMLQNKLNEFIDNFNSIKKENKKEMRSVENKNKENTIKISEIENMINELQKKNEEDNDAIDVINDVNNVGNEVDTEKVKTWIKNLEQKLLKKIEFSDKRNKNNEGGINELKNEINDIKNKLNNFELMFQTNSKDKQNELKRDEDENKDKKEDENNDKKEIKNIFDDFVKKEDLEKIKNEFKSKLEDINKNISENPFLNIDENKLYGAIIPKLEKLTQNLKDNVSKSIENNEKYVKNQIKKLEIDSIKDEIASIKKDLKNKLNKENLGSISLKLEDMENYQDNLRTLIDDSKNDIRLCNDKYAKIFKILETLRGQVLTLFEDEVSKNKNNKEEENIDLSMLVTRNEFDEHKEKMNKSLEKIYGQEADNYRMIQEIHRKIRTLVSETDLQNLEQYLLNLISETKIKISKTYVEKPEMQKSLKYIDIRVKQLEETSSKENENWLLAKKPINGFLCASCEAYIGDLKNNEDVVTWNKLIKKNEKRNYRIGHGFSTMLKMLNTDLLKKLEKENNSNNHSMINNSSNALRQDDTKRITQKNLPKIKKNIHNNETQNINNSNNSDEINENLNNSINNLKTHIQFERSTVDLRGQLSDRAINKVPDLNYFNKELTDENLKPKVVKIVKKNK